MKAQRHILMMGALLGLALMLCIPASALTIMAGSDYLETAPGTFVNLDPFGLPIPPLGPIELEGDPFGPGNTDTIIRRLDDADLPTGGSSDTIDIEIVALSLTSVSPVDIGGTLFDLHVDLLPSSPSIGQMTITLDDEIGVTGSFTSFFDVFFEIELRLAGTDILVDTLTGLPPLQMQGGGQWGQLPPPGAELVHGPYGDLDANVHTPAPTDAYDFFILGDVVEEHPGVGVHIAHTAPVPEPATMTLLGLGLAGLLVRTRKQII
jgi:hypothetical protein